MKKLVVLAGLFVAGITLAYSQKAIYIEKEGKGNPILFLPGFTTPGSVWNETIAHLSGSFETHVISYAGFNGHAPIGTPWYTPLKEQLIAYIQKEKLKNLTVIGHSMGGNLATEIAVALPTQVTGLILVDALPCMRALMMPGVAAEGIQYDSPYNNRMLEMTDEAFAQVATMMAQNMTNNTSKMEEIANWSVIADRETYVYGYTDLLTLDLRPSLSEIQVNTLILGASFPSKEMALSTFETQYSNLKNKTIALADDSKHFIMFDQPEWLYAQINTYLNRNVQ